MVESVTHVTQHDFSSKPTSPPQVVRLFADTLTLLSASKRRVTVWINSGHLQLLRCSPSGISARFLFKERGIKRAIPHLATAPGTNRRFSPSREDFRSNRVRRWLKTWSRQWDRGRFLWLFKSGGKKSYCDAVRVYVFPLSLFTPHVLVNFQCFLFKLRGSPI